MKLSEAIDALRPYTAMAPSEALDYIRSNWREAEPVLLKEIKKVSEDPTEQENSALFTYAIHLCAEMRSKKSFQYFVKITQLPDVVLDYLMGDITTETLPQMLARTCHGRIKQIKALVEDASLDEFARSTAMGVFEVLYYEEAITREELSAYCIELLNKKLERTPSNIWDTVIAIASDIQAEGALPLIKAAYNRGLADPHVDSLDRIITHYNLPLDAALKDWRKTFRTFDSTESAMSFFVSGWDKEPYEPADAELLEVLLEQPRVRTKPQKELAGRNDPCPCGSGKKYKKCCLKNPQETEPEPLLGVGGNEIKAHHLVANDWMKAGYMHLNKNCSWKAVECWKKCWDELLSILPPQLQNPADAESTGAFEGNEFLIYWIQDFAILLNQQSARNMNDAKYALEYLEELRARFSQLHDYTESNIVSIRAYCLAKLGRKREAVKILKTMIRQYPESALGYVTLSAMYSFDAGSLSMTMDIPQAIKYLQKAVAKTKDYDDYDVELRIKDLAELKKSMETPLL